MKFQCPLCCSVYFSHEPGISEGNPLHENISICRKCLDKNVWGLYKRHFNETSDLQFLLSINAVSLIVFNGTELGSTFDSLAGSLENPKLPGREKAPSMPRQITLKGLGLCALTRPARAAGETQMQYT